LHSEYRQYGNSIQSVYKLKDVIGEDGEGFYKFIPERELMDLQKKGFEENHSELLYENDMLRACIILLQSELNNYMAGVVDTLRSLDADTKILNHLAFDKYTMTRIAPMRLELPHSISGDKVKNICVDNIDKFKQFLDAFLKPADVYEILAKINKHLDYDSQILCFEDLDMVIKQWKNIKVK
jgi:hypothetical protein